MTRTGLVRSAGAVAARPGLWRTALRQCRRMVPGRWWSRPPFLPLPDRAYLELRLVTQYGRNDRVPEPVDVVNYLAWCKQWERAS